MQAIVRKVYNSNLVENLNLDCKFPLCRWQRWHFLVLLSLTMRLIRKELEQQKLEDCTNVPIESNHEYGSSLSIFSFKYNWIFISKPLTDVLILAEEVLAIGLFYQSMTILENGKVLTMATTRMMVVKMPRIIRATCSSVILMKPPI